MKVSAHISSLADQYIREQERRLGPITRAIVPAVKAKRPRTARDPIATGRARANKAIAKILSK